MTTTTQFATSAEAQAAWEAQERLQPGTPGFWKVWGASVHHVRPGDLVLSKVGDEVQVDLVQDLFPAKAAPCRVGFVVDGERVTIGALVPVIVLRWGTKNTLAS